MKTQPIKLLIGGLLGALLMIVMACTPKPSAPAAMTKDDSPKFEETWESLATSEQESEWFKDAKLGIYFHWGIYSVPAFIS